MDGFDRTATAAATRLDDDDMVASVAITSLNVGASVRHLRPAQERRPFQPTDPRFWEPIVVSCSTLAVVDGHRRVFAARAAGLTQVRVRWFCGSGTRALAEFVRLNTHDADGLDRRELEEAARRIVCAHPDWSDRRIGELCRISPKWVAQVRSVLRETVPNVRLMGTDARVGRDGRVRPLDARAQRVRVAEAIKAQPTASLREIAAAIGVSPETVRKVRSGMIEQGALGMADLVQFSLVPPRERTWEPDHAFTSRDETADIAAFLKRTDTSTIDPDEHSRAIPLSRIYEVADEARRRAAFWLRLAESVEKRSRRASL
jgi:hypothetical protein